MRHLTVAAGILVTLVVIAGLSVDETEVVTLTTFDARSQPYETGLWIAESDGQLYLRASSSRAAWLERLRARPAVQLRRGDATRGYRATPVPRSEVREEVTAAMRRKYGRADQLLLWFVDHRDSVPILLENVPARAAKAAAGASAGEATFAPGNGAP